MKKIIFLLLFCTGYTGYAQNLEVVGGYFPYWRSTSSCNFSHYNYLYFAFIECTSTGGLTFPGSGASTFNSFKTATLTEPAKKMISVGSTGMATMASNATYRQQFADTLRKFCRYHNLQGIDMDWEAIETSTDRTNFTSLMIDIRNSIDSTDLEFSITVGYGNYWLQWYENSALDQADFLQIMVYDQTGT